MCNPGHRIAVGRCVSNQCLDDLSQLTHSHHMIGVFATGNSDPMYCFPDSSLSQAGGTNLYLSTEEVNRI